MKSTDTLYRLVKSLDTQEKRHLRLYITKYNKENHTLKILFDTYAKMQAWNEEKLKENLTKKSIAQNLPYYKNKLYNTLLKGLSDYHHARQYPYDLTDLYKQAVILFRKKLYKEAEQIILKTKQKAVESEAFFMVVRLNRLYIALMNAEKQSLKYYELQKELTKENLDLVKKMENYLEYESLLVDVRTNYYMFSQDVGSIFKEKAEELLQHPLLSDVSLAQTNLAKLAYCQAQNILNSSNDYEKAAKNAKAMLHVFEKNPVFLEQRLNPYIETYLNYSTALILSQDFETAEFVLAQYREIPVRHGILLDSWLLEKLDFYYHLHFLMLYTEWPKSEKIIPIIPEIKSMLEQKGRRTISLHNDAYILFYVTKALFLEFLYDECLDWIKRFSDRFRREKQFTIALQLSMRLFEIMIRLEQKYFKHAKSLVLSFKRYVQEREIYKDTDRLMVSCFNRTMKIYENGNENPAVYFRSVLSELESLTPNSTFVLDIFTTYLKSKIVNKSFKEILIEESNGNNIWEGKGLKIQ